MPLVQSRVRIAAPVETVYRVARDVETFPEFMSDVQSIDVLEQEGERVLANWVGFIPQFRLKVRWQQEDIWDPVAHTCKFRQTKGDYDEMYGEWRFLRDGDGTIFESDVNYEYTVPTLGPLVKKVVQGIVQKNMESILAAIKKRAESV
jgi:uncharacterized membrane protein